MGTVGRASLRWRNIRRFEIGRLASPFNLLSDGARIDTSVALGG